MAKMNTLGELEALRRCPQPPIRIGPMTPEQLEAERRKMLVEQSVSPNAAEHLRKFCEFLHGGHYGPRAVHADRAGITIHTSNALAEYIAWLAKPEAEREAD